MEARALITKVKKYLSKIPRKTWLVGGSIFAFVLIYSLVFFIPKTVEFSYANGTCVNQLVIAPNAQKLSSHEFTAEFKGDVKLGGATLASTQVCFKPVTTPKQGTYIANLSLWGQVIGLKMFSIAVPAAPEARVTDIVGKQISTAEPLKVKLTSADVVHSYSIEVDNKSSSCTQASAVLSCDVASLNLLHGAQYTVALYQTYKDVDKKLAEGPVTTLQPLIYSGGSIANDQTIYDVPTSATFHFDRPVKSAELKLEKLTGEGDSLQTTPVKTEHKATENDIIVSFAALNRETNYKLTINKAIADNGSSIAEPVVVNFKTSGGPKVSEVSVGANSVARNATITVTLDQPIEDSVDITKFAKVTGVTGSVKKKSNTQLTFTIQGGDCTAFSLVITKGLKSGSNGTETKEDWSFNSRTICGYSWVIGYSVQGRAITAYSFGSGAKVILFTGGIHGSEPSGYQTMLAWAKYLQANGNIVPSDKRVVIVPNANPDGIAANKRYNANNVNVDRNFPTANWSASIETSSGTLPTGGGTSAGSEPEAAALIKLTRQLRPRLEVSFHAQGRLVGANKYSDSVAIGNTYASTVGYKTMFYNAEDVMGYAMTGEYEDWMGEEMGIAAILIELPSASGNYLNSQLSALKKMIAV